MARFASRAPSIALTLAFLTAPAVLPACGSSSGSKPSTAPPVPGQSEFTSAPPAGMSNGASFSDSNGGAAVPAPQAAGTPSTTTPARTVEETDLYRLDGNRLYYLNSYRGLMVFDVTNVDQPVLLGRSPIFGDPVDMVVNNGIAVVVVGNWYGALDDGTPFHGSIVRGLDATDPTNIKVIGDAKLGGWVQDDRVVGNVLYAVSEDYGWDYGWGYGYYGGGVAVPGISGGGSSTESVIVSSVNFANGQISTVSQETFTGYGGIFNVTPNAIMLAHDQTPSDPSSPVTKSVLQYLDISDPGGTIKLRGSIAVDGDAEGWGADNGRWNLDFADGKTAHLVSCNVAAPYYGCGDPNGGYVLATADFSNPDAPVLDSELDIPGTGWGITARFDGTRMYLSPGDGYYGDGSSTPFEIFDLTNPAAPALAGSSQIPGTVWLFMPSGNRLFALGDESTDTTDSVSLKYLDVTNPAQPNLLGDSTFGNGWAWTPAAGTFKAFTMDTTRGLVVLPFSGWDETSDTYNNGLQLIQFTNTAEQTAGAAHTKGWVERGIFVGTRLVSLSDLSLAVVDYSNQASPNVVTELTLARNVVSAQPGPTTIAEVSSDWWDNDVTSSDVRVLPIANAEETADMPGALDVPVAGVNAQVFQNGNLEYVVTSVRSAGPCVDGQVAPCYAWTEQVQVVDLSNGTARLRGVAALPIDWSAYSFWGWDGFYWYDWYDGANIVQVGPDALAFRRWVPKYDANGQYVDGDSALYVVDLSNADAPKVASTTVLPDPRGWWGQMTVVGQTLYTAHYEWFDRPSDPNGQGFVKYYADRIDLSDRAHPRVEHKINIPGVLVGGSPTDSSILYTIDYRWDSTNERNDFDVVSVDGGTATLVSRTAIDGYVGQVYQQGTTLYTTTEQYPDWAGSNPPRMELHALDLSAPASPKDFSSQATAGWGWLLGVQGNRAIVMSGWNDDSGVDIYRLTPNAAPVYDQFALTRGWGVNTLARQGNQIYLSSGYWGVQSITLQ